MVNEIDGVLDSIRAQLETIISKIMTHIPSDEPFSIAHGNPVFPGLSQADLVEEVQSIIDLIDTHGISELGENKKRLQDYIRRLDFISSNTIQQIWSSAQQSVPAFMLTMDGLRKLLETELNPTPQHEAILHIKKLQTQIRSMESTLKGLDPRTIAITEMVERIEQAYNAADRLPTDLDTLKEASIQVSSIQSRALRDSAEISNIKETSQETQLTIENNMTYAKEVLERCETAYSAATSIGLSAAFTERSKTLDRSMWFWVFSLIASLAIGGAVGFLRLRALADLLQLPTASPSAVALNLLLSILSVGAPVWFAWLATKQIGQRFRLSEDYVFKASISRAYEGFRREAARHGPEMEARLLSSALARLDEQPLRFVENTNHGSPVQELLSSDVVKKAFEVVPDFTAQVKELAKNALGVPAKALGRGSIDLKSSSNSPELDEKI